MDWRCARKLSERLTGGVGGGFWDCGGFAERGCWGMGIIREVDISVANEAVER